MYTCVHAYIAHIGRITPSPNWHQTAAVGLGHAVGCRDAVAMWRMDGRWQVAVIGPGVAGGLSFGFAPGHVGQLWYPTYIVIITKIYAIMITHYATMTSKL